jgi:hypothetical protein
MGKTAKELTSGLNGVSANTILKKCEEFLKYVEDTEFEIVPTFSAFADHIQESRAEMHEWLRLHPTEGKQMRNMVADTIAAGAMKKAYESRVASFALKNWCGWEETPQKEGRKSKQTADEKKAKEALDTYIATERRKGLKVV